MIISNTLNKFDKLYNETYQEISKYVVCSCNNIDDVKDIVQNIYLEAYKHITKEKNINREYLFGIAKNKIKDYYRFNYKAKFISLFSNTKKDIELVDTIKSDIDIERSYFLKYDTEKIWNYLKRKPVIISKIFYLYYYLELTIKEISKELNITESNTKNYLYRTLKELKTIIGKESDNNV